jgi:hypothetical protein
MSWKCWRLIVSCLFILFLIVAAEASGKEEASGNFIKFDEKDNTFFMMIQEGIQIKGNFIESPTDYKLTSASADIPVIGSKSIPAIVFSKIDNEHITYSGLKYILVRDRQNIRNPNGITTYVYEKGSIFKGKIFDRSTSI